MSDLSDHMKKYLAKEQGKTGTKLSSSSGILKPEQDKQKAQEAKKQIPVKSKVSIKPRTSLKIRTNNPKLNNLIKNTKEGKTSSVKLTNKIKLNRELNTTSEDHKSEEIIKPQMPKIHKQSISGPPPMAPLDSVVRKSALKSTKTQQKSVKSNSPIKQEIKTSETVKPAKSEKPVKTTESIQKETSVQNDHSDEERLFILSETPNEYHDKWVMILRKFRQANKRGPIQDKMRNGKFRINKQGNTEIRPDMDTYGKTSKDLLTNSWNI